MPFVHDESESEWSDEDEMDEPPPPRADAFGYLTVPEYGGRRGRVRFPDPDPERGAAGLAGAASRLVGRLGRTDEADDERSISAILIPALRELGVRTIYWRYDGGHDEGFVWLDHARTVGGSRLDAPDVVDRLAADATVRALLDADLIDPQVNLRQALGELIDFGLGEAWATALLGKGFGTGEYSMYGAFSVDLETREILDDPDAEPITQNISLDRGD